MIRKLMALAGLVVALEAVTRATAADLQRRCLQGHF